MTNTTLAAYAGSHECPGRTRRCSVREHVPRAPSLGPPLGWAPLRAQSSPPRLSCSNSLRHAEELVTELRRALVDLHGSKSVLAFARDEFYIGPIYGVTGPKVRPSQRRRHRRCEGAIRRALCGESALPCSRPRLRTNCAPKSVREWPAAAAGGCGCAHCPGQAGYSQTRTTRQRRATHLPLDKAL